MSSEWLGSSMSLEAVFFGLARVLDFQIKERRKQSKFEGLDHAKRPTAAEQQSQRSPSVSKGLNIKAKRLS